MKEYYLNLEKGSGIGSNIFQIIGAQYILETKNIKTNLIVNLHNAAKSVKFFFNFVLCKKKIENIIFTEKPIEYFKVLDNYIQLIIKKEELLTKNQISIIKIYDYYYDKNGAFERYLYYFEKLWIINKEFIYNKKLKKYDICVNLRRGSKVILEPELYIHTIPQYCDIMKQINLKNPKIIHTCCSYETFLEFKKFDPKLNIENSVNNTSCRGYWISDFETKSDEEIKSHIKGFMKQLEFMQKTLYFIGTTSSNVGYIVSFLRRKKINSDKYNFYHRDNFNLKIINEKIVSF